MNKKTFENLKSKLTEVYERNNPFSKWYKVYNDGGHYIASEYGKQTQNKVNRNKYKSIENYFIDNKISEFGNDLKNKQLCNLIVDSIGSDNETLDLCNLLRETLNTDIEITSEKVSKRIQEHKRNYYRRVSRFYRKGFINNWNYFLNFTYDSKKMDENTFRVKLCKLLQNLHTRNGWKYMGIFENGEENNRLHFHAVAYIPEDSMIGNMRIDKSYSTKQHKMQSIYINDHFENRFGRNHFEKLEEHVNNKNVLSYLIKYLLKSGEKVIYSRGIPSSYVMLLSEEDLACEMKSSYNNKTYILFDNIIAKYKSDNEIKRYEQMSIYEYYKLE